MTEQYRIGDIKQRYSEKAVEAMRAWDARVAEIRELRGPDGDAYYLDRLDDTQRMTLLREQKLKQAEENRRELVGGLRAAHEQYSRAIAERAGYLRERLFAVPGPESAWLLARTATASEGELASLLEIASAAGNEALAKAVFVAADRRDIPELRMRYLSEVDPEAEAPYSELMQAPSEETISKQFDDIDQFIAPVGEDQLAGRPQVSR